jgi:hypothetical protein
MRGQTWTKRGTLPRAVPLLDEAQSRARELPHPRDIVNGFSHRNNIRRILRAWYSREISGF